MHQFWMRFIDHYKIKSWIEDCRYEIVDTRTVKLFIAKCYYDTFLLRETAEDMKITSIFETQYLGSRLPVTLQNIIDTADSRETFARPLRPDESSSNRSSSSNRTSRVNNGAYNGGRNSNAGGRGYNPAGRGYNGGRHNSSYNGGRTNSTYNGRNNYGSNSTTSYPVRQLLEYGDVDPEPEEAITDYDDTTDEPPELLIQAVYRSAGTAQRFQKSCMLCNSSDHLIHKCPALNERDATQLLRLNLQSAQLLDRIQKQAKDQKLPIQETKVEHHMDDDEIPESPPFSDFQQGSS